MMDAVAPRMQTPARQQVGMVTKSEFSFQNLYVGNLPDFSLTTPSIIIDLSALTVELQRHNTSFCLFFQVENTTSPLKQTSKFNTLGCDVVCSHEPNICAAQRSVEYLFCCFPAKDAESVQHTLSQKAMFAPPVQQVQELQSIFNKAKSTDSLAVC